MARKSKKAATTAEPANTGGLLIALNRIVYGKNKIAPPNSPFFPASEAQREELFRLGAVREPTEAEVVLFGGTAPAPPPADPAADDDGDTGDGNPGEPDGDADDGDPGEPDGDAGDNPLG